MPLREPEIRSSRGTQRRHRRVERAGPVAVDRPAGRSPPAPRRAGPEPRSRPAWRSPALKRRGRARPGSAAARRAGAPQVVDEPVQAGRRHRRGGRGWSSTVPPPAAATSAGPAGAPPAARCSRCRSGPSGARRGARPASAIGPLSWRVGSTPVQTTPGRRPPPSCGGVKTYGVRPATAASTARCTSLVWKPTTASTASAAHAPAGLGGDVRRGAAAVDQHQVDVRAPDPAAGVQLVCREQGGVHRRRAVSPSAPDCGTTSRPAAGRARAARAGPRGDRSGTPRSSPARVCSSRPTSEGARA